MALSGTALSSSSDVLAIAVADVDALLQQRPVDVGLSHARLVELGTAVRRLGSNTSGRTAAECPPRLITAVPTLLKFLRHCHSAPPTTTANVNAGGGGLRQCENLVANLVFLVVVWLRQLPSETTETLCAALPFLLNASRIQLAAIHAGSIEVHGLPPLAHNVLTEATLSPHDDYVWLATVVLTKVDSAGLQGWLKHGADAPQADAFLRVTHRTAVATLLFSCLRMYEAVFRAIALEPRPSVFPLPALHRSVASSDPTQAVALPLGFRVFLARALTTANTIAQVGCLSAQLWTDALRLSACVVHVLLLSEMVQLPDTPSVAGMAFGNHQDTAESVLARQDTMSPRRSQSAVSSGWNRSGSPDPSAPTPSSPSSGGSLAHLHAGVCSLCATLMRVDESSRFTEATATQLCKLALLLAASEGFRQMNGKPVAAGLARLARELIASSKFVASETLRETMVTAFAELLTTHHAACLRYTACLTDLHEPFMHCVDLLVDAHTPLQSDMQAAISGVSRSSGSAKTVDRDDAWRSALRAAMLLVEAHRAAKATAEHQRARAAHAWWQLTMLFVRLAPPPSAANGAAAKQGGSIPSAACVVGDAQATWNDYDGWAALQCAAQDEVSALSGGATNNNSNKESEYTTDAQGRRYRTKKKPTSHRGTAFAAANGPKHERSFSAAPTSELLPVEASLGVALLCFDRLLASVASHGVARRNHETGGVAVLDDKNAILCAVAEYCESLAAVAESSHVPLHVVTHLLEGAARCYERAGATRDAMRVGLGAHSVLSYVACDLPSAFLLGNELTRLRL